MDIIRVVCGIIYKDDKIFICRRAPHKSLAGYWEFPGGKVESGESEKDALSRELREELGMEVSVREHFKTVIHSYETATVQLISYICKFHEATYILTDHDKFEWIGNQYLNKRKLAPADVPIADELINYKNKFTDKTHQ